MQNCAQCWMPLVNSVCVTFSSPKNYCVTKLGWNSIYQIVLHGHAISVFHEISVNKIFFGVSYFPWFFLLSLLKNDILYLNIYVWDKMTFRWWGGIPTCSQCFNVELRKNLATPLRTLMHRSSCLLHQSDFKIFLVFDRRLRWKWSAVKGARGWRTDYGIVITLVPKALKLEKIYFFEDVILRGNVIVTRIFKNCLLWWFFKKDWALK